MAQARLQGYLNKRSRAYTSPMHVTPSRPAKRAPLESIQETDEDNLVTQQERLSPIASLCTSTQLQLSFSEVTPQRESGSSTSLLSQWSTDELEALVQFVLENGKGDVWATPRTTQQSVQVWNAAATFIQRKVGTAHVRTSTSVS